MSNTAPKILYKYQSPSLESLWTLDQEYFFFSPLSFLNDPMENKFSLELGSKTEMAAYTFKLLKHLKFPEEEINERVIGLLSDPEQYNYMKGLVSNVISGASSLHKGVFSTSSIFNSPTMWAHYCSNHFGWVIGFQSKNIFDEITDKSWQKVEYNQSLPIINLTDFSNSIGNINDYLMKKVIATKLSDWSYEKEYRLVSRNDDNGKHEPRRTFNSNAVIDITFGLKTSLDNKKLIARMTKDWGIKYYEVKTSKRNYEFDRVEVKFDSFKY